MKDKKLEQEFGEYFKGVNIPDDITDDAKRYVKPKQSAMPKFLKFASIAASFALVFAVSLTIILKVDFNKNDDIHYGGTVSPSSPAPDDNGLKLYTDADLTAENANAYSISTVDSSLKFIENFAIASNASVNSCTASYRGGKLALAKAEITILSSGVRDDITVFVEFTEKNTVYSGLEEYYEGREGTFRGAEYYLTQGTAENGEPQFKLHVTYKGVKYYFNVTSTDEKAYERYLNLIVK